MDSDFYLLALRREATALATAARDNVDASVPSCPEWDVRRLVAHVGGVYRWVRHIVSTHADARVEEAAVPGIAPDGDLFAWFEEGLAEVVETLTNEAADSPAWNWSEQDMRVAFWVRRMAHETVVHRWDAELAAKAARPIEAELAADGVDEVLGMVLPFSLGRRPRDGLSGTFLVRTTDTGDVWHGTLKPDHVDLTRTEAPADATLAGTASDLVLALWGRDVPVTATGDERITGLLTE